MPLKSGIETILHRKFINFSFKAQNSHFFYYFAVKLPREQARQAMKKIKNLNNCIAFVTHNNYNYHRRYS